MVATAVCDAKDRYVFQMSAQKLAANTCAGAALSDRQSRALKLGCVKHEVEMQIISASSPEM